MTDSRNHIPAACRRLHDLAERDPRRTVPLARRALAQISADDPLAYAWAQYTLGWALLCWERFEAARPELRAAWEAFATHGAQLAALRCRHALLLADLMQFARPNLEQEFAELAQQFEQAGAPLDAARAWLYQAVLFNVLGRPAEAESVLRRIAPSIMQDDGSDWARLLRVQGVAAILLSDYSRAINLLTQAEQYFLSIANRLELAKCWYQQAWAALRRENLESALVDYERAAHIFNQLDVPLHCAFSAKNVGLVLTRLGMYDRALHEIMIALKHFTALRRTADIGGCQLNLGNIYFYTARWEAAEACYSRAEDLYVLGNVVSERLIAQRNRAMVYRAQGRRAEAAALLSSIEVKLLEFQNWAELAEIWSEQAGLFADDGQIDDALARYQQASDLFVQVGNLLGSADCAMEQGFLLLRRDAVDQASKYFQYAAPKVVHHPYDCWRVDYGLARCAEARNDTPEALLYYRTAITTVAALRRRLANEQVSSSLFAQAARLHADALRLAAASGDVQALLAFGEQQRALVLARMIDQRAAPLPEEYQAQDERLRRQISLLSSVRPSERQAHASALDNVLDAYGELLLHARHSVPAPLPTLSTLDEDAFDLSRVRAALGARYGQDWTALVYTINDDTLLIGVITPDDLILESTPYDPALQRMIERAGQAEFRQYIYRDLPYLQGQSAQRWVTPRTLTDRLLPERVRRRLGPTHRLLIVPAGPLHTLPWAALRLADAWLAEQAIIQLAPSLSIWQSLAARHPAHGDAALLLGCSDYDARAAPLPAVGAEIEVVAKRWPGACFQLRDEQATRTALLDRSASGELIQYGLLHMACHAQLLPARGLAAHLKLWDGDLLLPEIAGLRLGGGLVVLSACAGAAADTLPGEEILSLSWAFLAAGANAVIAGMWPLDDQAAVPIMAGLYQELRSAGDAAAALARAQRALIAADPSEGAHLIEPQDWGSFVLVGEGR
jgi:CHAT domain-containing protein